MKTKEDVEHLEKLIGQLQGLHTELTQLAKKSPNDGLNKFKLGLVNKVVLAGNKILTGGYKPFDDFEQFDEDNLPSNSDVTMVLALYIEQAERYRSDNVERSGAQWVYKLDGKASQIVARSPTRIGGEQ